MRLGNALTDEEWEAMQRLYARFRAGVEHDPDILHGDGEEPWLGAFEPIGEPSSTESGDFTIQQVRYVPPQEMRARRTASAETSDRCAMRGPRD